MGRFSTPSKLNANPVDNRPPERPQHDSDESGRKPADGGRDAERVCGVDCAGGQSHLPVEGLPSSTTPPGSPYGLGKRAALPLPGLAEAARAYATKPRMTRLRDLTPQVFDQLWLYGYMSRDDAYVWMASTLELPADLAHIAKLSRNQLAELRAAVKRYLRDADHRGELWDRCESRVRRRAARNDPAARGRHRRINRKMRNR